MVISTTLIIVCILIIGIWVLIEIKRLKHKLFAIFLIGFILFSYFSVAAIFKDSEINFKTSEGLIEAGNIYFSWLYSVSMNVKSITINAIKMNWGVNETLDLGN